MTNFLKGYRTYIIAVLIFIVGGCKALGWIEEPLYGALLAFLGSFGLAALRASK